MSQKKTQPEFRSELYRVSAWLIRIGSGLIVVCELIAFAAGFDNSMMAFFAWSMLAAITPLSVLAGVVIARKQAIIHLLQARSLMGKTDDMDSLFDTVTKGATAIHNIRKAVRCTLTNTAAQAALVLLGLGGLALQHVAPAVTGWQLVAVDIFGLMLPIAAFGWDTAPSVRSENRLSNLVTLDEVLRFGLLAALLAYGNFLLFFVRIRLSPRYLSDLSLPQYHQATTLTFVTLLLCMYAHLKFERLDQNKKLVSEDIWSNERMILALSGSFAAVIALVYIPWLQPLFKTGALGFIDWLTALACSLVYVGFRLMQRQTRLHTRRAVVDLHIANRQTDR